MRTAAYARYSTDMQRDASIDDQLRNIRARCEREGWQDPEVYADRAMSGARKDRPAYLRLLADAHRFDVVLVDDLSRLSRDSVEVTKATRWLTHAGVRVIGVSDGVDTHRKGYKADVGLRGLMSELYIDDLREKTHRGLTGRALAGASAGGLPFGYRVTETGQRAIDEAQAAVVRRIHAAYLAGKRARTIAAELNREGVPSPRGSTWAASAIHGDVRRGIGILANPIYAGRQIWNRSRWEKHPETRLRTRFERPRSEWITTEHPELVIVTPVDFDAVQRLLRGQGVATGCAGRPPRHLLSGILRCGSCGGPLAVINADQYGCSNAKQRGTCATPVRVRVRLAEDAIVGKLREALSAPEAFDRFKKAVTAAMKRQAPDEAQARRTLAEAEKTRANILRAIRAGILTASTKAEMLTAEKAVSEAQEAIAAAALPTRMLPDLRGRWARLVRELGEKGRSIPAAREALRSIVGSALTVREVDGVLMAEGAIKLSMVAGAGYGHSLCPISIPIQSNQVAHGSGRGPKPQRARPKLNGA